MAIAHDADSNASSGSGTNSSGSPLTWSHTCTGSNLLLVVGLSWTVTGSTMSITQAGNAPTGNTQIVSSTGTIYNTQIWWWVNPTTGAQNIVATPSTSVAIYGGGTSFTGVDSTVPVPPLDRASSIGNAFGTVSTALNISSANEMLYCLIGMATTTSTIAAAGGATESFNQFNATNNRTGEGEFLLATTKGSYTMSQTISGAVNRPYAQQVIAINPTGNVPVALTTFNDYQFVGVGDGISVTEKIR